MPAASAGRDGSASARPRRVATAVPQVRVESAVEVMADLLRTSILNGELEPGALLPTERDLAEESGLSRGSVRQALKSLTVEGLVSAKVGRNGGYVIQRPPSTSVVRSLDGFIRGRGIHHTSLLEVREVIEPKCAALAAARIEDGQLARLRELTQYMAAQVDDVHAFLDLNIDWHVLVAEASGNEVFSSVMTAISTNIRSAIGVDEYDTPDMTRAAQHLHETVLAAIEAKDAAAAERRMRRHLEATNDVVDEVPRTPPTRPPGRRTTPAARASQGVTKNVR